jgi:predicted amidophosphoribosyltransferase
MPLPPCRFHRLQIPLLFPMILGSVCPILWLRNRKNPAKNGACPVCGYDLRATPDRCPECGAIPPKRA